MGKITLKVKDETEKRFTDIFTLLRMSSVLELRMTNIAFGTEKGDELRKAIQDLKEDDGLYVSIYETSTDVIIKIIRRQ